MKDEVRKSHTKTGKPKRRGIDLGGVDRVLKSVNVFPGTSGKWKVKVLGTAGVSRMFASKEDAVAFAQKVAQAKGSEVLVHKKLPVLKVAPSESNAVYILSR